MGNIRTVPIGVSAQCLYGQHDSNHSRYRRVIAHSFSDNALADMRATLHTHTNELVSSFREKTCNSDTGTTVVKLVD